MTAFNVNTVKTDERSHQRISEKMQSKIKNLELYFNAKNYFSSLYDLGIRQLYHLF